LEKIAAFFKEEQGASMVEYGLLVAMIALVAVAGVILVGDNLLAFFNDLATRL